MYKVDLHCHSSFSDGAHDPSALIEMAHLAKLDILALTDHDTISGLKALHKAQEQYKRPLHIVNGIELSVRWKKHEVHLLGLKIPLNDCKLNQVIERQQDSRKARALSIAEKLEAMGLKDVYEKARQVAGHEHLARPHFAKVLLAEGHVKTLQQGFDRFLGRGKKAFVPTNWINFQDAVEVIVECGGQAVIAHPLKYALTQTKLRELIAAFKEAGGCGIEVVSGEIMLNQLNDLTKLCSHFDLLASTGSDFHSVNTSRIKLGGQYSLPLNCTPIWNNWTL